MKKYFYILLFLIVLTSNIAGLDVFTNFILGEYACYLDYRMNIPYYRCYYFFILNTGEKCFYIRSLNLEKMDEVDYQVFVSTQKTGYPEITKLEIFKGNETVEHKQVLADLINYTDIYYKNKDNLNPDKRVEDPWEKYTLYFDLNNYLSLFRIKGIFFNKEKNASYFAEKCGLLPFDKVKDFFKFLPIEDDKIKKNNSNIKLIINNIKKINLNSINITLDDNWNIHNDLNIESYWIEKENKRDSMIFVEKGDWTEFKNNKVTLNDYVRRNLLFNKFLLIPTTLKIKELTDSIEVEYYLIDNYNVSNVKRIKYFIKDNYLYMINFSSFVKIYENNIDYFNQIFNSIEYQAK